MDEKPKRLLTRILEFAALLALSAFLVRLAMRYVLDVWPVLLVVACVVLVSVVCYRLWKRKNRERW